MSIIELFLLGIGLAMDCLAISIAGSIAYGKYNWRRIFLIALFFGGFQGLMPLIGWGAGVGFSGFIDRYDHWIALAILGFIGGKMIAEGFSGDEEPKYTPYGSLKMLVLLSIADSIDALATGLLFVSFPAWLLVVAVLIIAAMSFIFSIFGCVIGIEFGKRFRVNVNLIGGIILIAIGLKIFIEGIL